MSNMIDKVDTVAIIDTSYPNGSKNDWHLVIPISQEAVIEEDIGIFLSEFGPLLLCFADWVSSESLRKVGTNVVKLDEITIKNTKSWLREHLGATLLDMLPYKSLPEIGVSL
jgi:hypothetical protein